MATANRAPESSVLCVNVSHFIFLGIKDKKVKLIFLFFFFFDKQEIKSSWLMANSFLRSHELKTETLQRK